MKGTHSWVRSQFQTYSDQFSSEALDLEPLRAMLAREPNADYFSRSTLPGHVTASAIVLHPESRNILMVLHRGLNIWLFPGGHVDPGEYPVHAAAREALEETGLLCLSLRPEEFLIFPLDIECHWIPENLKKQENAHWHFDFRYPVMCEDATIRLAEGEILDFRWLGRDEFFQVNARLARKLDRLLAA